MRRRLASRRYSLRLTRLSVSALRLVKRVAAGGRGPRSKRSVMASAARLPSAMASIAVAGPRAKVADGVNIVKVMQRVLIDLGGVFAGQGHGIKLRAKQAEIGSLR